jgi:Rrf2 family protein
MILLDIALNGDHGPVRTEDIANRRMISKKYLEKLLRRLKDGGYITSKPGPGGGHMLKLAAKDIRIGEVFKSLDGDGDQDLDCGPGSDGCQRAAVCLARTMWQEAWAAVYKSLNVYTLDDLIRDFNLCPKR